MELLFQGILILVIFKFCIKAAFFYNKKGTLAYALFAGLIAIAFYPVIIETNTNIFSKLIVNKTAVSNIAVLITIEAISGMLISIGMLHNLFEAKKQVWIKILKLTPGILILGAIYYIELVAFKTLPGLDFFWVAVITSIVIIIGVLIVSSGIFFFMPGNTMRYELKFIINIILLILAITMNAALSDYNRSSYNANVEFNKLFVFIGILTIGFLLGWGLYKNKHYFKNTKNR